MNDYQTDLDEALHDLHLNGDSGIVQSVFNWLNSHLHLCLERLACDQPDSEVVFDLHRRSVIYRDLLQELDECFGED